MNITYIFHRYVIGVRAIHSRCTSQFWCGSCGLFFRQNSDSKLKETKWIFEYIAHNIYVSRVSESENFQRKSFSVCTLACQNDWHLLCRQSFHLVNWFWASLTRNCYAENGEKGYFISSNSFPQTIKDKKWFFLSMLLNSYAGMKISNKTEMWPSFRQYFRPLCLL